MAEDVLCIAHACRNEHCVLWGPGGTSESAGLLLRFPPGAHGDFPEHLGHELMLVRDGVPDHSDGMSYGKGDPVVEGPGTRHQISGKVRRAGLRDRGARAGAAVHRIENAGDTGDTENAGNAGDTGDAGEPAAE
ncbi:hypothetical protein [Streptomyces clavuligerus]|uniref:Uncharacterized protein n=1 Tax=Streptomyces clavuligerus TaxID=1901 RepID=B5GQ52_STRCL|nr:hypothetical protein [Streptomyces clavuligerus]ANW18286.1 hypothetical protein BB341_08635 [Streptomyces clavuligerus]AXU12849.1 hypothetical protein D1794_08950 [Streptomyces clavuligerus]EDY48448.1 hypothetical protein SSCG_01336 [Streptomyces clavuligerus]EFG09097.1 Hypothetical protein SCLAV_4023 [Streptomyces clavuligerus]MBY6302764.1 hypothetical protein [Streptomyces clavuligerus]